MTESELDRLAALIAQSLLARRDPPAPAGGRWLPTPVRPETSPRGGEPPLWSGAALDLSDVAPGADSGVPRRRAATGELTNAVRAAAAGRGTPPEVGPRGRVTLDGRRRGRTAPALEVRIGVSNHHVHLSPAHFKLLLGADAPTRERPLAQPGQFAAAEMVTVIGPSGRVEHMRVVGPLRSETQLELAPSDCRRLGITAPVAASGSLADSAGGVKLEGHAGTLTLERGVIVAARHLHLAAADAQRWGLRDGDTLDVRCGIGSRAVTFHGVLVRSGPTHATELHLDADEALAAGVRSGDAASIVRWESAPARRRALVTERDVLALARAGQTVPPGAILTPSARDRASALGILPP
ncbi:MAG: PduL/EutD family phosphate acyltransferase [Gemmatimonadota bacterium]|nr:PduL/EutD family phosphate acyltransferase [Gemmatimonadota bacterium]